MPKEYARSERMASQIQRELASLVQTGLKDPRLSTPSILEVQVSKDLAHARVFFSVLQPEDAADCLDQPAIVAQLLPQGANVDVDRALHHQRVFAECGVDQFAALEDSTGLANQRVEQTEFASRQVHRTAAD